MIFTFYFINWKDVSIFFLACATTANNGGALAGNFFDLGLLFWFLRTTSLVLFCCTGAVEGNLNSWAEIEIFMLGDKRIIKRWGIV